MRGDDKTFLQTQALEMSHPRVICEPTWHLRWIIQTSQEPLFEAILTRLPSVETERENKFDFKTMQNVQTKNNILTIKRLSKIM